MSRSSTMVRLSKARPPVAAESAAGAGGVSTEAPRRSERLQQAAKRSRHASPPSPAPGKCDQEIEAGSVDDVGAEFSSASLLHLTAEEIIPYYKRLYKKRANMGLAWYHKNNQEDCYEFTSALLNDVYDFMDGGVCYMHMNFKARNVKTRSEKLFFAELAASGSVSDENGGYSTTACSIVGDNCVGGMKHLLGNGLPEERYDEQHCYVCDEEIKHPPGQSYKGGHYAEDYCIGGLE